LETLASRAYCKADTLSRHQTRYFVTPAGFARYAEIKRSQGQPIERVQQRVRSYFDSERFKARHPTVFKKWQEADELLWKDDSHGSFTTIGHLCREAMQEFASSLLRHDGIVPSEPDPAKIVSRLRQFIEKRKAEMGNSWLPSWTPSLCCGDPSATWRSGRNMARRNRASRLDGKTGAFSYFTSWW
jgi:hypothetical protein